jgi:hypothetical protein
MAEISTTTLQVMESHSFFFLDNAKTLAMALSAGLKNKLDEVFHLLNRTASRIESSLSESQVTEYSNVLEQSQIQNIKLTSNHAIQQFIAGEYYTNIETIIIYQDC